ncbi:hypothetical protein GCM10011385_32160 [Nitratireductor aestuarii]|uniref:Uncharacterized protein n=1 Tax=Nitratireductor aestuarii TaxID=1735103 RepID=A0A916S0P3_9HYPH|nr:hypothetical protein GCM10011385_32160 [Nitratireductor aestuarii]
MRLLRLRNGLRGLGGRGFSEPVLRVLFQCHIDPGIGIEREQVSQCRRIKWG